MAWRSAASTALVHVLRSLLAEADLLMAVDGYPRLDDRMPEALRSQPFGSTSPTS